MTWRSALRGLSLVLLCAPASADDSTPPFELLTLPGPGRTAFAEIADLDGDGRGDVVTASFGRLPPDQRRTLRVHFQREDGAFREAGLMAAARWRRNLRLLPYAAEQTMPFM
jgi:hypothetical protein